jgi:hypothetical protein
MSQQVAPNPQADADRLEAEADEAIAACGGDVREALKALIVANEVSGIGSLRIDAGCFARLCGAEESKPTMVDTH